MVRRYGLRDDQWERIEHVLPSREATVGVMAKDNRLFGEAVMYRYRVVSGRRLAKNSRASGGRCRSRIGDDRFHHRPRPPARFGDKREDQTQACIGRSQGGLSTNIHATCEALGNPTGFHLLPGQAHDLEGADALLPDLLTSIHAFVADKAYDAQARVLELLKKAGVRGVIPPRNNRKEQRVYDEDMDKARHLIEDFFATLKQFRGIATRYDKRAHTLLGAIYLTAAVIWLN